MTRIKAATQTAPTSLDVRTIPWSYRGSYISLSTLAGDRGLATPNIDVAIVSHFKPYGAPCFVLRPEIIPLGAPTGFHTTPSPVSFQATPGLLRWVHEGQAVAEATFCTDRILRLRGTVPLSFDTDQSKLSTYFYQLPRLHEQSLDTVDWASMGLMPLRLVAVKGRLATINAATFNHGRITIHPADDGKWELLIMERSPSENLTSQSPEARIAGLMAMSFDQHSKMVEQSFERYANGMTAWKKDSLAHLDRHACYVMWTSTVRGEGFLTKETVLMSKLWMNKIWSWDNCFNALALAAHPDLLQSALDNFMEPFLHQLSDGRIPDAIMYSEFTWDFTKPPIQGWTLERLLQMRPDISDESLDLIYGPLKRFTDMWLHTRRTIGSELPYYTHGNDSGWDNSTSFDGDQVIINADLASHLVLQVNMLAYLSKRLGKPDEQYWISHRERLVQAMLDELWDGEQFRVKRVATGTTRRSSSLLQLVPLTAARFLPRQVVQKMIEQVEHFLTPWGLASEPVTSEHYESDGYWRGPIWAPSTTIIESGLREAGCKEMADEIKRRFFQLCVKGGFAENFDAVTGEGHRDLSHTWTSSVYLLMRRQHFYSDQSTSSSTPWE